MVISMTVLALIIFSICLRQMLKSLLKLYFSAAMSKLQSISSISRSSLYINFKKVFIVLAEMSSISMMPFCSSFESVIVNMVLKTSLREPKMNLWQGKVSLSHRIVMSLDSSLRCKSCRV
eukprot:09121.XXX_189770_190129_1 [CDS] Oithona nana genome sequencing.